MTIDAAKFLYGRGLINSMVTGLGGDSMDVISPDQLPGEAVEFLRLMSNHYFKDDATRNKRMSEFQNEQTKDAIANGFVNYEMLNNFGNLGNMFKFKDESNAKAGAETLKTILGQFTIKAVEEDGVMGYRIYDKYDFNNNTDYFKSVFPEIYQSAVEDGYDTSSTTGVLNMVGKSISKNLETSEGLWKTITAVGHPISRALAGSFINQDEMDEDDKIKIDFFIPANEKTQVVSNGSVNPIAYPEPRPDDLDTASAVIPNGPMDDDRASVFQDFMNFIIPKAEASTIEPVVETKPLSFGDTFKQARADGLKEFEFTNSAGKTGMYTTELAQ
tara:strand:- start:56 stop:1045 length:990 start_codon:yes stop_codon:yes gene_type:complete